MKRVLLQASDGLWFNKILFDEKDYKDANESRADFECALGFFEHDNYPESPIYFEYKNQEYAIPYDIVSAQ